MSGAPKRLHEEGSHSTPLKRPIEETSIFYSHGKLIYPAGNDFRLPFESGQDGRLAKVHRIEPRDVDKRVSLLHRMATSPGNSLDHPVTAENKSELRNSKDARHAKTENRETKAEIRELYTDTRIDHQGSKVEKDVKLDTRVNEKEIRSDRVPHSDFKGDVKFDSYTAANSHFNLKETKEHHRGKRYFEPTADGLDSWRARHGLQSASEVAKNLSTAERDLLEIHEAVGENKVDMKGDEKNREKEKKRKDEKYRDSGERDKDRNDRQNNLQVVGSLIEHKEPLREERETEKWKRERSDAHKDKEYNDTEKDPTKGEPSDVHEKESLQYEKELIDEPARISEREIIASPLQQHKDDGWRTSDTDVKDRGGRMDVDVPDKHEKQGEFYDKETDDGCADGDGVVERNGEVFGYGFQQRRRMLRSRGAQAPHREPHFRSRAQDNEGSQGQSEVSTVIYKPGVCMQELLKTWREYEASQDFKTGERFPNGPTLEIQIPAEYVTATNRQVRGAQLWGTDIYTNDSDLVAVLMHTGYCRPTASPPPVIHELWATVQVWPPQDCYASTLRNNVRSRAWGAGIGCSFRVERCCIVKKGGGMVDLEPRLTHISAIEPTLAPVSVERTITTRAAASNALRQQRLVREVTVQYNLCNEPWLKYSISIVADKGLKKPLYTSARLKKGGVLYLETHHNRYELCFSGERAGFNGTVSTSTQAPETEQAKPQNHNLHIPNGERYLTNRDAIIDVFRWSRCKKPLPQKIMRSIGIPLPVEHLEVLEEHLEWEDVQWSQTGVWVAGKEYVLARVHFLSQT